MIFSNAELNKELEAKGYVVLPFLDSVAVNTLRNIYSRYKPGSPYFHSTTFSSDLQLKQTLSAEVDEVFSNQLTPLFSGYKKMGASFLTKPPGKGGHMPIHQDWTIVDETKYGSYTIWVPLQDVDELNGAITVLDGSHLFSNALRGPTLPVVINDIEDGIKRNMKTLRMKAGDAFIFNHALIHASHINQTDTGRIAVTYGLLPANAQLMFYHMEQPGKVEKYIVPDDFFMRYADIGKRPGFVTATEILDMAFPALSNSNLDKFLSNYKMNRMKPLFKDAELQKKYEQDGYVLIDMLSPDEVETLRAYYATLNNDHIPNYGFHVSLDNKSADFVTTVMQKIRGIISGPADKVFKNYKIFTSSFVVKESNPIGIVPPHQDWSFTEEDEGFCSATVWTALVDTDMNNGAMGVIVGSHKFFNHHRASPAPEFKTPLDAHVFSIFPYLKLIPMKPGQALIFDNRTIHASPPNISDGVRLAVGFGVTQDNAPLRHFYMEPGSNCKKLEKYEVDDFFFTHYNNARLAQMYAKGEKPTDLKLLEVVDNRVNDISADDLVAKIKAEGNTFNVEMCEHLAKLFNYNMDGSKKSEPEAQVKQNGNNGTSSDNRSFFQKYTPLNVLREIRQRVML